MGSKRHLTTAVLALTAVTTLCAPGARADETTAQGAAAYAAMAARVANMNDNRGVVRLARKYGLDVLNLTWEDTARDLGSSVGPNISDVTIEVETGRRGGRKTLLMPVLRFPNFTDKTGDVPMDRIKLRVGNQTPGGELGTITLTEFLRRPTEYLSRPKRGSIRHGSLLAPKRDSHVLVSAQAAFLPVPKEGQATFWPAIFNYQSSPGRPAVLTLVATRQGTSVSIVDNGRDLVGQDSNGQRLFFNAQGQRAPLTAERKSDVVSRGTTANGESAASVGDDANLLMMIQVPLYLRALPPRAPAKISIGLGVGGGAKAGASAAPMARREQSDVETAVLGHGKTTGPMTELGGMGIARDTRYPVRVTVQFYQATTSGAVSASDMERLAKQIRRVYQSADYVGSLVVPESEVVRPTQPDPSLSTPAMNIATP